MKSPRLQGEIKAKDYGGTSRYDHPVITATSLSRLILRPLYSGPLAIIISYLTSASGIIVLLKTRLKA